MWSLFVKFSWHTARYAVFSLFVSAMFSHENGLEVIISIVVSMLILWKEDWQILHIHDKPTEKPRLISVCIHCTTIVNYLQTYKGAPNVVFGVITTPPPPTPIFNSFVELLKSCTVLRVPMCYFYYLSVHIPILVICDWIVRLGCININVCPPLLCHI